MKRHFGIIIAILILISVLSPAYGFTVEFTQEDRERLIRLEVKVEESQKFLQKQIENLRDGIQKQIDDSGASMQKQIDDSRTSIQKQIDDVKAFMLWGFGILFGGMGILIGFVIWDRRTAIEPVARLNRELAEKEEKMEKALKEFAKVEPRLAEILRSLNL